MPRNNWPAHQPWLADYNQVRAAGWTFDHDRRCWRHASGVWAACNQSTILVHLRAGTAVPLRDEPPNVVADRPVVPRSQRTVVHVSVETDLVRDAMPAGVGTGPAFGGWSSPRVQTAVQRATVRPSARPQKAAGKVAADWRPNVWEA